MGKFLHEHKPREQDGRDAVARFKAQYRAAAIYCLRILEGGEINAVFCDLHDDFVVRKIINGNEKYDFYQVKTNAGKGFSWSPNDIYGVKLRGKQEPKSIVDSFVGKLMLHTIAFTDNCLSVNLQSNKDFHPEVYKIHEDFENKKIENKFSKLFFDEFRNITLDSKNYSDDEIKNCLCKLNLIGADQTVNIDGIHYLGIIREKIVECSEIHLEYSESQQVIMDLLSLVESKSVGKIYNLNKETIEEKAAIQLKDLLSVMAITPSGYEHILSGGDPSALRTTSIISRIFKKAGAGEDIVDMLCRCKSKYDVWLEKSRHYIDEVDYQLFTDEITGKVVPWLKTDGSFKSLLNISQDFHKNISYGFSAELSKDMILGSLLCEIVRQKL